MNCIPDSYPINKLSYMIYEYGLKKADIVIVLADYMKKALFQNYGLNSIVIKSGHSIPEGPFEKQKPPTILWIARLNKTKRPELFLRIAKNLQEFNVNFILIGVGSYMKDKINQYVNHHKNLTFIPGVRMGEDNYYYNIASILVNTSSAEGYPNSFIQAWLRETPVFSLDVDPDCDICKNNLGFHAKGDINALIDKIKELIGNQEKLKEMGKKCRKYAIQNHDIRKTAEKHYVLYKWLINNEFNK